MNMTVQGKLIHNGDEAIVQGENGKHYFEKQKIWDGYVKHWLDKPVYARLLPQKDYEQNQQIVIMWPVEEKDDMPFIELYYNERLVKYWASALGHNALNINGNIYNFSHLLNENEVMTEEEFFYRPALGEFAPSPTTGRFEADENGRPYFDKFGRNFMRTIHVLRIKGIDIEKLKTIFDNVLDRIHSTPVNPRKPEKYRDFNIFTNSCASIIRDGLNEYGFDGISGVFPRDLFISAAYRLMNDQETESYLYKKPQLMVPEAPESALSPILNPVNISRARKIRYVNR